MSTSQTTPQLFDFSKRWNEAFNGNLTLFGVLLDFWEDIAKRWKSPQTRENYLKDYDRYVIPCLNDKPLRDYSREDFDRFIDEVLPRMRKSNGHVYNESTHKHFQHLIKRALEAAEENGICTDILWGTQYAISESVSEEELSKKELVKLRKSLSIQEEIYISNKILIDANQSGELFGLALMFCLGTRNQESCSIRFRDIKPFKCDPTHYVAYVYSTLDSSGNAALSGKTSNMVRIIPVPSVLMQLLALRRTLLIKKVLDGDIIPDYDLSLQAAEPEESAAKYVDNLYIACHENNYTVPCTSPSLTKSGSQLLKEAGVNQEQLALIDLDIRRPGRTEEGIKEKDPTTYLLRRNLGSHLYFLGLDDNEIQYIMGHEIEDPSDKRFYYRNEEKLYPIALKMSKRPIVNSTEPCHEVTIRSGSCSLYDTFSEKLIIPTSTTNEQVTISIRQREPRSKTTVQITSLDSPLTGTYTQFSNQDAFRETVRITQTYSDQYSRKLQQYNNIIK